MIMDVIIADVPISYGMLLSRSWGNYLGDTLDLDMSYPTILILKSESHRIYIETKMVYTISDPKQPRNEHAYEEDVMGCLVLTIGDEEGLFLITKNEVCNAKPSGNIEEVQIWKTFFDGACSQEGVKDGVLLISPKGEWITLVFKLEFANRRTNNTIVEYESLALGLELAHKMEIELISIFVDLELIVKQVTGKCQAKHPRLHTY